MFSSLQILDISYKFDPLERLLMVRIEMFRRTMSLETEYLTMQEKNNH